MFKIKANDQFSFDVSEADIEALDIIETAKNKFHILHNNASVKATILEDNFNAKSYSIKVNNNTYDIVIADALDQQIEALGLQIGVAQQVNAITAPMPGMILEISIKEGQEVTENDTLIILEAMKMENVIHSPRDGVIKSIQVAQGETVEKNTLLIEFE